MYCYFLFRDFLLSLQTIQVICIYVRGVQCISL